MKKMKLDNRFQIASIIIILLLFIVFFSIASSLKTVFHCHKVLSETNDHLETAAVVFPESLSYIGDEAFYGTDLQTISFGDELLHIGDRAFWSVKALGQVILPECIKHIGLKAFPFEMAIYGSEGSYAESWAKKNGYQFIVDSLSSDKVVNPKIRAELLLILMMFVIPVSDERKTILCKRIREIIKNMRPQERPELYPINYKFP